MSKIQVVIPKQLLTIRPQDMKEGHLYRRIGRKFGGHGDVVLALSHGRLLTIHAACGNPLTWSPWEPQLDYEFVFIGKLDVQA